MDIRQLQYFIAVAEERHMGRAALRLHMSQPPLTRHIHALEAKLGVHLFTRTPRGMELTQAGEALYQDACSVKLLLEQAADRTRRTAQGERGTLDIGVFGSSLLQVVPQLVARFTARYPDVKVVFHNAATQAQLEALRQRRVLIAFERFDEDEPDLARILVAKEPIVLAMHASHRLAAQADVAIASLAAELLILPAGLNSHTGRTIVALTAKHGIAPQLAMGAGDVISTLSLMACGGFPLGAVALVPASSMALHIPQLVYRPLQGDAFMALHALYRKGDTSPLLASFLACLGVVVTPHLAAQRL
jgi:LysR family transcriptional regulator, benzoate and cis,cis-muconate-responsive activator of ben and cat genes